MFKNDSDKEWVRLGRRDPYLQTVKTLDPYKLSVKTAEDAYFLSGRNYVAELFHDIERHLSPGFKPRVAVDFGCSVGRIAIPLAGRCERIVGLDVSPDVLEEAGRNAEKLGVRNASWLRSDDELSAVVDSVDLFHSYNVLQHLSVDRGLRIIGRALALLAPGGVLAVHVPYADRASPLRRALNWTQAHIPGISSVANIVRGRPVDYPQMMMNAYSLESLFSLLQGQGLDGLYCKFIDQDRYPGVVLIAQRSTK